VSSFSLIMIEYLADSILDYSHEWMFVTDTVDAIYPPDSWLPQAIMDRLGEILSDPQHASTAAPILPAIFSSPNLNHATPSPTEVASSNPSARKPLLAARKLSTITELEPFFATVSLAAYESTYNCKSVDWRAVETGLERDLFEG